MVCALSSLHSQSSEMVVGRLRFAVGLAHKPVLASGRISSDYSSEVGMHQTR